MQVNAEYAQTEASRADSVVQDEIDKFEQMKLTDIKKYMTDFTLINLAFHARAMEMYTYAHQQLLNIDIARDLEVKLILMNIISLFIYNPFTCFRSFVLPHRFIVFIHLKEVLVNRYFIIQNEPQQEGLMVNIQVL